MSSLTGSLVAAFYLTFPPVILGLLLLLRARHTLEDDARAIVTAIYEENQLLERERAAMDLDTHRLRRLTDRRRPARAAAPPPRRRWPMDHELIELERQAWVALSSSGEAAAAFYSQVLADDVLMLLPGGMVIGDRAQVVDSMRGAPWDSFKLVDERVLELGQDSAAVTYRATARRAGQQLRGAVQQHVRPRRRRLAVGAAPADTGLTTRLPDDPPARHRVGAALSPVVGDARGNVPGPPRGVTTTAPRHRIPG